MNHIMKLAHNLLQYFCYENPTNQAKLYDLYFNDYQQLSEVRKYILHDSQSLGTYLNYSIVSYFRDR